jgi:hypothetical protein
VQAWLGVKNDKHVMKFYLFVANIVRNVNQGLIDSGKKKLAIKINTTE